MALQNPNNVKITINAEVAAHLNLSQNHETLEEYESTHPGYVGFFTATFLSDLKAANSAPASPIWAVSSSVLQLTPANNGVPPTLFKLDTSYPQEYPMLFVGTGPSGEIESGEQTIGVPCPPMCANAHHVAWTAHLRNPKSQETSTLVKRVAALRGTERPQLIMIEHGCDDMNMFDQGIWTYLFQTYFIKGDENPAKRVTRDVECRTLNISQKTIDLYRGFRNELRDIYAILPEGSLDDRTHRYTDIISTILDRLAENGKSDNQFFWDLALFRYVLNQSQGRSHSLTSKNAPSDISLAQLEAHFMKRSGGKRVSEVLKRLTALCSKLQDAPTSSTGVKLISGIEQASHAQLDHAKFEHLHQSIVDATSGDSTEKPTFHIREHHTEQYDHASALLQELAIDLDEHDENIWAIYSHRIGSDIALHFKGGKRRIDTIGTILSELKHKQFEKLDTLILLNCGFDLSPKVARIKQAKCSSPRASTMNIISFQGMLYRIRYETFTHMYFLSKRAFKHDEAGSDVAFELASRFSDVFKLTRGYWSNEFKI